MCCRVHCNAPPVSQASNPTGPTEQQETGSGVGRKKKPQTCIALTQHDDPWDWAPIQALWSLQKFITGLFALEAFAQTRSNWFERSTMS